MNNLPVSNRDKARNMAACQMALESAQEHMEYAILACPSGTFRNALTEVNIHLMACVSAAAKGTVESPPEHRFPAPEEPDFPFSDQEEFEGLRRMKLMGGSFACAIAAAWFAADLNNRASLRREFVGLLQPYVELYRNGQ